MRIHLIDVQNQLADLREDMRRAIDQVLEDGQFILGPNVRALEEEMASLCGAAEAVGVANGTDALVLLLRSLGVGPGDEVITAPYRGRDAGLRGHRSGQHEYRSPADRGKDQ